MINRVVVSLPIVVEWKEGPEVVANHSSAYIGGNPGLGNSIGGYGKTRTERSGDNGDVTDSNLLGDCTADPDHSDRSQSPTLWKHKPREAEILLNDYDRATVKYRKHCDTTSKKYRT